jgi:hypothetical protein
MKLVAVKSRQLEVRSWTSCKKSYWDLKFSSCDHASIKLFQASKRNDFEAQKSTMKYSCLLGVQHISKKLMFANFFTLGVYPLPVLACTIRVYDDTLTASLS